MGSKPRGAPKKPFVHDPERYAIAIADALMALGASEAMTPSRRWLFKCLASQSQCEPLGQGASAGVG